MIPTDILNYRIVRHLGSGGMGSVYLAVNTNIDQQVAIKALNLKLPVTPRSAHDSSKRPNCSARSTIRAL